MSKEKVLAKAIFDAAVKAGGCREDANPNGPELLMLCDDMAEEILRLNDIVNDLKDKVSDLQYRLDDLQ